MNGYIEPNAEATKAAADKLNAHFRNAGFAPLQASSNAVPVNIEWAAQGNAGGFVAFEKTRKKRKATRLQLRARKGGK